MTARTLLFLITLLLPGSLRGGAIAPPVLADPAESAVGSGSTLDAMLLDLEAAARALEEERDVKCWTSFRQLETFVAGRRLTPAATHLRTRVVMNYLDQVWTASSDSSSMLVIAEEDFRRAVSSLFPHEIFEPLTYELELGDSTLTIPYHDVDNYMATVEPIRVMQTLTRRIAESEPSRPGLSRGAMESAIHLVALLSAAVLKEANAQAAARHHPDIEPDDLLAADGRMTARAGLLPYDPPADPMGEPISAPEAEVLRAGMLSHIRDKIRSLAEFNTTYSREALHEEFVADLTDREAEWAGLPVDRSASRMVNERFLPGLANQLYTACAAEHPGKNPLSGPDMLETIQARYPHVVTVEGRVNLFPREATLANTWIEEYQADTFRDSAWHWRALGMAMEVLALRRDEAPSMDLYALEELSEFLSV